VVSNIVLGLNYELLESSHEILDCLFALLKGKEMFFCVSSDVRGLKCLLELVCELIEGAHGVQPLSDIKICPSSSSVLSFHIGQDDQHILLVRRLFFEAGKVQFHRSPPLNVLGPISIIRFGLGGDRFADSDVRPSQWIGGKEPWRLGSRREVDPRGPWHESCSRNR